MRKLWVTSTALMVCLTIGAGPAVAQDATHNVAFDGVAFSFDEVLGSGTSITQVPGQPSDAEQPFEPDVAHLAFTLYGPRDEGARVPRVGVAPSVVRFYRTADLTGTQSAQQLDELTSLLAERPDLAAYMEVTDDGSGDSLPFVPVIPAAQVIRARAQYVDTAQVTGVAYVTVLRQDISPFASSDFWYTFQGLSTDGSWYVSADFVVDASMFPEEVTVKDANRIADATHYPAYLKDSIQALNEAAPNAFAPPLTTIDALVQSITFVGARTTE
jgi:hypothetical protein